MKHIHKCFNPIGLMILFRAALKLKSKSCMLSSVIYLYILLGYGYVLSCVQFRMSGMNVLMLNKIGISKGIVIYRIKMLSLNYTQHSGFMYINK